MSESGKQPGRPGKPVLSLKKRQANRREFIHSAVLTTAVVGFSLVGLLQIDTKQAIIYDDILDDIEVATYLNTCIDIIMRVA